MAKSWDLGQGPEEAKFDLNFGSSAVISISPLFFRKKKVTSNWVELEEKTEILKSTGILGGLFPKVVLTPAKRAVFSVRTKPEKKRSVVFCARSKSGEAKNSDFHQKTRFFPKLPCYTAALKTPKRSI